MEHRDAFWPGGPFFFYDDALFKPSTDSFLLGAFARPRPGSRVCDLGSGTGFLSLLLLARQPQLQLTLLEIQPEAMALAEKAMEENGWSDRCRFYCADLRCPDALPPAGSFDLVISNPPYFRPGAGAGAKGAARQTARESGCSLDELCAAAGRLLRFGASFCLVFRPERMAELFAALQAHRLEPKRLCLVQHRPDALPSLLLLEARMGGKAGLQVDAPWILQREDGSPTALHNRIYFREE